MKFPDSGLNLIQEEYRESPWKMLVACMMLNRTTGKQVRPVLEELFSRWPNKEALAAADDCELRNVIAPCGMQAKRSIFLRKMSALYGKVPVQNLPGVGKYATDSWKLFQLGEVPQVMDKQLKRYVTWLKLNGHA